MDAKEDSDYSELLQSLENVVMDLNDMENMIDNFEDSKPDALFEKVNEYIRNLKEVQRLGARCTLQVPREALERLDNDVDQNPEVFAQELLTRCKDEFGQLNTRVQGIRTVRQTVADGWRNRGQAGSGNVRRESDGGGSVEIGGENWAVSRQARRKAAPKSPGRGLGGRAGVQGAAAAVPRR